MDEDLPGFRGHLLQESRGEIALKASWIVVSFSCTLLILDRCDEA